MLVLPGVYSYLLWLSLPYIYENNAKLRVPRAKVACLAALITTLWWQLLISATLPHQGSKMLAFIFWC
jgi:hypothetical protein